MVIGIEAVLLPVIQDPCFLLPPHRLRWPLNCDSQRRSLCCCVLLLSMCGGVPFGNVLIVWRCVMTELLPLFRIMFRRVLPMECCVPLGKMLCMPLWCMLLRVCCSILWPLGGGLVKNGSSQELGYFLFVTGR